MTALPDNSDDASTRFSLLEMDSAPRETPKHGAGANALAMRMDLARPATGQVIQPGSPAAIRAADAATKVAPKALTAPTTAAIAVAAAIAAPLWAPHMVALMAALLTIARWGRTAAPLCTHGRPLDHLCMTCEALARKVEHEAPDVFAPAYDPTARVRFVPYDRDSNGRPVTGRLACVSPFPGRGFPADIKRNTDAAWDKYGPSVPEGASGVWSFDARHLHRVRSVLQGYFQTDGGALPPMVAVSVARTVTSDHGVPVTAPVSPTAATQPIPFVPAADLAAQRHDALAADLVGANGEAVDAFATVVAEGQHMAARSHLVRGGVLPSEVNPVAGFNSAAAGQRASLATAASAAQFGQTAPGSQAAPIAAPVNTAPIVGTRPLAADLPEAVRAGLQAARDRAAGQVAQSVATVTASQASTALTNGQLVAGAKAEGQGSLMGWSGKGEATRPMLVACLAAAGAPAEWAPVSKSAHAHAGAAVNALNRHGWISRIDRKIDKRDRRQVAARWIVGLANTGGEVGAEMGRIALTVTLSRGGALTCDGAVGLAAQVTDEYTRLRDEEAYSAGDVTQWLATILIKQLGAVRMAQAWYVRHGHVAMAESILTEVAKVWGTDWLLPALPVATSAQLRAGLASGLTREATDILTRLEAQRATARKASPPRSEIGSEAAATLLGGLRTVNDRVGQYALILGEEHVAHVRAAIKAALDVVEPLCDGAAIRGAMLEMD